MTFTRFQMAIQFQCSEIYCPLRVVTCNLILSWVQVRKVVINLRGTGSTASPFKLLMNLFLIWSNLSWTCRVRSSHNEGVSRSLAISAQKQKHSIELVQNIIENIMSVHHQRRVPNRKAKPLRAKPLLPTTYYQNNASSSNNIMIAIWPFSFAHCSLPVVETAM